MDGGAVVLDSRFGSVVNLLLLLDHGRQRFVLIHDHDAEQSQRRFSDRFAAVPAVLDILPFASGDGRSTSSSRQSS